MLMDSAASKLRAKVRKMSQQDLQSEDGFREKQRLQAHDEATSAWVASQGKLLRATPLKCSAAARLHSLARDTASIKATSEATMKNNKRILANQEAMLKHLRAGEARKERRALWCRGGAAECQAPGTAPRVSGRPDEEAQSGARGALRSAWSREARHQQAAARAP